jgi:hypothetical protein
MDRRQFLEKTGRFSLLAALVSLSGFLAIRSFDPNRCKVAAFCKDCGKYDECDLPEKDKKKQTSS